MRLSSPLTILSVLALFGLPFLGACGGGGGGSTPPTCTAPGTLTTLAVTGESALGTAGLFDSFPTDTVMACAEGGWCVFVASTTDSDVQKVLYVVLPNGTLRVVFAAGDSVPAPATGLVENILYASINTSGEILAVVSLEGDGGGRTRGVLTAYVDGATVTGKAAILYDTMDMSGTGLSGNLTSVVNAQTHLGENGSVFVGGSTSTGNNGFWRADLDGGNLELLVGTGSSLPGGRQADGLELAQIDAAGDRFVVVANTDDGGAPQGVYVGMVGSPLYDQIALLGQNLQDGSVLAAVPPMQAMVLYPSGSVVFRGIDDGGADHIAVGGIGLPVADLAVTGDVAPGTGGFYGSMSLLNNTPGTDAPMFQTDLVGAAQGVTYGIYGIFTGGPVLAMFDGRTVPSGAGGGTFSSTFPGLRNTFRRDVSANGSLFFANVTTNLNSGEFWLIPGCGLFTIAISGGTIPGGGDSFGDTSGWSQSSTDDTAIFRAPLAGGGSGIFRRG